MTRHSILPDISTRGIRVYSTNGPCPFGSWPNVTYFEISWLNHSYSPSRSSQEVLWGYLHIQQHVRASQFSVTEIFHFIISPHWAGRFSSTGSSTHRWSFPIPLMRSITSVDSIMRYVLRAYEPSIRYAYSHEA